MRVYENDLSKQLTALLSGGNAHMPLEEAVKEFPMGNINDTFPNGTYSPWALLEHIRITQFDILDFIINPNYKEMNWPKDYWPAEDKIATEKEWYTTIHTYKKDLEALKKIVKDPATNFSAKIKWGNGQTILREMLLVADHTAYHVGEFAIMRQVMHTWGKHHSS